MEKQHEPEVLSETDNNSHGTGTCRQANTYGRLRKWARVFLVETGGIERVTDEDRQQNTQHVWNACTFWYARTTRTSWGM